MDLNSLVVQVKLGVGFNRSRLKLSDVAVTVFIIRLMDSAKRGRV